MTGLARTFAVTLAALVTQFAVPVAALAGTDPEQSRAESPEAGQPTAEQGAPPGVEIAFTWQDPRIRESSGLVASQLHDGVVYTHNDSGPEMTPDIYAVGPDGETLATLRVEGSGVEARDWESIALGEGPDGEPALFVGDIGDNFGGAWPDVRVHRVPEPRELVDQTLTATTFTLTYEDGGRDAEAMFVDPVDQRLYVVSKEVAGGLYAAPEELDPDGPNELTRAAPAPLFATGASIAPDGQTYVIRTYWNATVYDASDGVPGPVLGQLTLPEQDQGEGIAHTSDGSAVLVSSEGEHTPVWRVPLAENLGGTGDPDEEGNEAGEEPADAEPSPAAEEGRTGGGATGAILVGVAVAAVVIAGIVALVRRV